MMAYIEAELQKRKGGGQVDTAKELSKLDPHDELYRIADKYLVHQRPCVLSERVSRLPFVDFRIVSKKATSRYPPPCSPLSLRSTWALSAFCSLLLCTALTSEQD